MARPKNKEELIHLSCLNFDRLNDLINSLPDEDQLAEFPESMLNRNIRDVLAHLHHWHLMMLSWYREGMAGIKPDMPAKGYSWKTTPELNKWIQQKYQAIALDEVKELFMNSFKLVQEVINKHSNEELFEKKRYKWTGTTSLGAYLVSATSSHYDWAFKLIRKAKR